MQVAQAADGGYYWRVTWHDGRELAGGYSRSRDSAVAAAEQWLTHFDRSAPARSAPVTAPAGLRGNPRRA